MWRKVGCIVLIVIAVAIVAGIIYQQVKDDGIIKFGTGAGSSKKTEEDKKPNFEAARIDQLILTVEATGSTEPITDIEIKSEATGRITEFYVEEGDVVAHGDLICKLDQSNQLLVVQAREIQLSQARLAYDEARQATSPTRQSAYESGLASAQANLDNATEARDNGQFAFDRVEELHVKGYATDQEMDNARQNLVAAQAGLNAAQSSFDDAQLKLDSFNDNSNENSIEQSRLTLEAAKVSLNEARKQLGDSVITSPITGIILEKPLDTGDSVVSINSAYGGGNAIVKVADLSRIQIRTFVDEIDIGKIKVGQSALVTVDTYFDREFEGAVTNIFPQGVTTGQGLVNFVVMIEVDNTDGLLLGNMTASVKIDADIQENVLLIPLAATRAGDKQDSTIVYILKDGEDPDDLKAKTEEREVKLGDTDYYDVVILEGLEEGDMVKVRGFATSIRFD